MCSMGDVAASGGYMIASACDKIVAQPTTITGSIGVIFLKLSIKRCEQGECLRSRLYGSEKKPRKYRAS